jgi:hypothetical protein
MNAPGLPSILPLLERLQRPPLRFAAQTTAPIAGEGRRRCARLPFGAFSIMAVRISVNTSFSVATPAFATGHWGFPSPTTRFLDLASPVEASWVSREAGGAGSAPRKQSIWRLPSAPPVFCPPAGSADFQPRDKASVRAPDLRVHSPSNATVSAADPAPSASLIPGAHQVRVRAMAALCERPKGVWTKLFWRFQVGPLNRLEESLAGDKTGGNGGTCPPPRVLETTAI